MIIKDEELHLRLQREVVLELFDLEQDVLRSLVPVEFEQGVVLNRLIPQIVLKVFKVIFLEILTQTSLWPEGFVAHSCLLGEVPIANHLYLDLS